MKFYLAARYSQHPEMQGVRDFLQGLDHTVTSRWIDLHNGTLPNSAMQEQLNSEPEELAHFGLADLEDIDAADAMISFTLVGGGKGGRHVEFGYGLATGMRMILIGPREHIFHTHPNVEHYDRWHHFVFTLDRQFK